MASEEGLSLNQYIGLAVEEKPCRIERNSTSRTEQIKHAPPVDRDAAESVVHAILESNRCFASKSWELSWSHRGSIESSFETWRSVNWLQKRFASELREEAQRLEMLARQHAIRQKRDDGGIGKALAAYIRRADEGALSRLLVETSILLAASRSNPATILRDAARVYKMDTHALPPKG